MAKSKYIEALEEQYTKKDAKSILRYKAPDNKWRYIQTSKDASGGTPMPSGDGMTEVTWQELKVKRDNGELNPGSLYRITDYQCTTTQENTRSAGHQFDIVLLALSEDKLAEEGWAMEHPTDVYDVTFDDGVTKKCYLYGPFIERDEEVYNIIDVDTLLGFGLVSKEAIIINEETKTAITTNGSDIDSTDLTEENLTYNYFQNSNLSAWKVWYCLDNDTERFAWADDSVDEGSPASITVNNVVYVRDATEDVNIGNKQYYGWINNDTVLFTRKENNKDSLTTLYERRGNIMIPLDVNPSTYTPPTEGTGLPNGRGVIYRLIDEFNNDVGYDFKNIQHKKNITDGLIDQDYQGTDMYIYPFNIWINEECQDASLVGNTLADDVNTVQGVCNNTILNPPQEGGEEPITLLKVGLNTTCFLSTFDGSEYYGLHDCFVDGNSIECAIENSSVIELTKCTEVTIVDCSALKLISCVSSYKEGLYEGAMYIGDKKVLTED